MHQSRAAFLRRISAAAATPALAFRPNASLGAISPSAARTLHPLIVSLAYGQSYSKPQTIGQLRSAFAACAEKLYGTSPGLVTSNKNLFFSTLQRRLVDVGQSMNSIVSRSGPSTFAQASPTLDIIAPFLVNASANAINLPDPFSTARLGAAQAMLFAIDDAIQHGAVAPNLSGTTNVAWTAAVSQLPLPTQLNSLVTVGLSALASGNFDATKFVSSFQSQVAVQLTDATSAISKMATAAQSSAPNALVSTVAPFQAQVNSITSDLTAAGKVAISIAALLGSAADAKAISTAVSVVSTAATVANTVASVISGAVGLFTGVGTIGAALGIIGSLFGGGPSPEMQILTQIQQQITALANHMDSRFDRLEELDQTILDKLSNLAQTLDQVLKATISIEQGINNISAQLAFFKTATDNQFQKLSLAAIEAEWGALIHTTQRLTVDLAAPNDMLVDTFVAYALNADKSVLNGIGTTGTPAKDNLITAVDNVDRIDAVFGALTAVIAQEPGAMPVSSAGNFVEFARGVNSFIDATLSYRPHLSTTFVERAISQLWNGNIGQPASGYRSTFRAVLDPSLLDRLCERVMTTFGKPRNDGSPFEASTFLALYYARLKARCDAALSNSAITTHAGSDSDTITYATGWTALSTFDDASRDPIAILSALGAISITQVGQDSFYGPFPPNSADPSGVRTFYSVQATAGTRTGRAIFDGSTSVYAQVQVMGWTQTGSMILPPLGPPSPDSCLREGRNLVCPVRRVFTYGPTSPTGRYVRSFFSGNPKLGNFITGQALQTLRSFVWELRDYPAYIATAPTAAFSDAVTDAGSLFESLVGDLTTVKCIAALALLSVGTLRATSSQADVEVYAGAKDLSRSPQISQVPLPSNENQLITAILNATKGYKPATFDDLSHDYAYEFCNYLATGLSQQLQQITSLVSSADANSPAVFEDAIRRLATLAALEGVSLPPLT